MGAQNRYCTRCSKTTKFLVDGGIFTCVTCGVRVELQRRPAQERILWGDPYQFRIRFV